MGIARPCLLLASAALLLAIVSSQSVQAAGDPGRRACAQEARRLCPAEMKSLSRRKVEACMIVKINQTSPECHAAMLQIKAQREGQREATRGARLTPR